LLLEKGARLHPFNIEILYQLGIAYYENGQLESARQAFLQVEKLQENYSETRRFLDLIR
jgi:Flp pilus assembly protein TadD